MQVLTKNQVIDLDPSDLRINYMSMEPVRSGRVKELLDNDPEFYKSRLKKVSTRIFGNPEDVAETTLFIVFPEKKIHERHHHYDRRWHHRRLIYVRTSHER